MSELFALLCVLCNTMASLFVFLCALQLALLSASAFAQEAPVTDCDSHAASDQDPQRKSTGISFDKIDAGLAVPACEAAVQKYPDSSRLNYQLGLAYQKANNFAAAVAQYRKAADLGNALAQAHLGWMYGNGFGVPRDPAEALKWFRKAADQGNALAQTTLGWMYQAGRGVPQNYAEALKWFRLAADQGSALAQTALGLMYQAGHGVPQNYAEALKWFRLAADQGNALAQNNLGLMYQAGYGVPQNYAEALKWYRLAADQGNALAQNNLGAMNQKGYGVPQNYPEALKWYRLAADQGNAYAQTNLGLMYGNGFGVPRDSAEAIKWYRLAAAQRNALAQYLLGFMYQAGQGVPKDDQEAVKWFRPAAEQGNADAQTKLGEAYAKGWGVREDDIASYMWLAVGDTYQANSILIPYVAGKMAPAQIALAQKMAKQCKESNYKQCGEPQGDQFSDSAISVPMRIEKGTYVIPVRINDAMILDFVVDSGAADVSIPADVVMTLMRTGTLRESDFLGEKTYVLADGSKMPSRTFRIRSLKVGNRVLQNVTSSIAPAQGVLLLGQSFLSRFKSWSVDNSTHSLLLSN
jgi:uncharacterized protein